MYGCGSELRLGRSQREGPGVRLLWHQLLGVMDHTAQRRKSMPLSGGPAESRGTRLAGPEHPWTCKAPEGGRVEVELMPFSDSEGRASISAPHVQSRPALLEIARHEYKARTLFLSNVKKTKNLPTYKSVFQVTKEKGKRTPCFIFCGFKASFLC